MLLSRLFGASSAVRPVDLDGLATLELPASFHLDDTPERRRPTARRLHRQPYLHLPVSADQLTYYLPSHDRQTVGGRVVPVLLRVTLYADDVPLAEAPDQAYFHAIARQDYHYDGQREAVYARATPAGEGLYFTEESQTAPNWFLVKAYHEQQGVQFFARLGTSTLAQPATPPYFTASNPNGRYLASFNQQAILQQDVPAGHELRQRTGVSEPLWFPPEEFAAFRLADLLRETDESRTLAQRQPGFVAAGRSAPSYWDLSRVESTENRAALGQPADYRFAGLRYGTVTGTHFTLHYVGTRTAGGQPPQLVFTLKIFDSSPRYRTVAADAQYYAVDAGQGGQLNLTVAEAHYRVRIEPPAQGHLTVEPL